MEDLKWIQVSKGGIPFTNDYENKCQDAINEWLSWIDENTNEVVCLEHGYTMIENKIYCNIGFKSEDNLILFKLTWS